MAHGQGTIHRFFAFAPAIRKNALLLHDEFLLITVYTGSQEVMNMLFFQFLGNF